MSNSTREPVPIPLDAFHPWEAPRADNRQQYANQMTAAHETTGKPLTYSEYWISTPKLW